MVASLPVSKEDPLANYQNDALTIYDHFNTIILGYEIDASFTFASNLNEAKNGRLSPLPHDHTRPNTEKSESNVLRQGREHGQLSPPS